MISAHFVAHVPLSVRSRFESDEGIQHGQKLSTYFRGLKQHCVVQALHYFENGDIKTCLVGLFQKLATKPKI